MNGSPAIDSRAFIALDPSAAGTYSSSIINDLGTNSNNFEFVGPVFVEDPSENYISFDGVNDYLKSVNDPNVSNGISGTNFSFLFRIKFNGLPPNGENDRFFSFNRSNSTYSNQFQLRLNSNRKLAYYMDGGGSGGNDRVRLKLSADKRTVFMEDLTDGDFNDLVLTITGGKFHGIKDHRFLTYEGGPSEGGSGSGQPAAPRFPASVDDIKLKGINPMALAIDIKVSYGTGQRVAARSWYENPMGVAFNIRAPLAPPPQEDQPKSEGRCPNNPIWTTRFPGGEQSWYPVRVDFWKKFMNRVQVIQRKKKSQRNLLRKRHP